MSRRALRGNRKRPGELQPKGECGARFDTLAGGGVRTMRKAFLLLAVLLAAQAAAAQGWVHYPLKSRPDEWPYNRGWNKLIYDPQYDEFLLWSGHQNCDNLFVNTFYAWKHADNSWHIRTYSGSRSLPTFTVERDDAWGRGERWVPVFTAWQAPSAPGTYTVTAQAGSKMASATIQVVAYPGPPGINVAIAPPSGVKVQAGHKQQFRAVVWESDAKPTDPFVSWAIVSGGGKIDARTGLFDAAGVGANTTTVIEASAEADPKVKAKASVEITATAPSGELTISPSVVTLSVSGKEGNGANNWIQLYAHVTGGGAVTWTASDGGTVETDPRTMQCSYAKGPPAIRGRNGSGLASQYPWTDDENGDVRAPVPSVYPGERHPYWQTAYDTKRHRVWQTGGAKDEQGCQPGAHGYVTGTCSYYNPQDIDLYYYDDDSKTKEIGTGWTMVCAYTGYSGGLRCGPENPGSRKETGMVYDPDDDLLVMYGGMVGGGGETNQVWTFNPNATPLQSGWSRMRTKCSGAGCVPCGPGCSGAPIRGGTKIVYDTAHHRVIAFGGYHPQAMAHNDTWVLQITSKNSGAWTQMNADGAANAPPPGKYPALAFDARRGLTYLQEGGTGDTWSYDYPANAWRKAIPCTDGPRNCPVHHNLFAKPVENMMTCDVDSQHDLLACRTGDPDGKEEISMWSLTLTGKIPASATPGK